MDVDTKEDLMYDKIILNCLMSTLSVPLTADLETFIESMVKRGDAANKADVVRRALKKMAEDEAVKNVMEAMQELKEGKILRGDIRQLMKQMS